MKCMKLGVVVKRVQEQSVPLLVKQGWAFCPKSEWKTLKKGKTAPSQDEVVEEAVKVVKKAKGAKVKKNKVVEVETSVEPTVVPEVPKVVKKAKKKVTIEV